MDIRKSLKRAAIGAAATFGAVTLAGCVSTNHLDKETCVKVDTFGAAPGLPEILKWFSFGYNFNRLDMPCIHSQYFMRLNDVMNIPGNENNHHIQGKILENYDKLVSVAQFNKGARNTLGLISERFESQGMKMEDFIADLRRRHEENKPHITGQQQEASCWNYKVRENGRIYDDRYCEVGTPKGP